ncbi:GyrI-like domain-containing protein [Paenibacillus roseipurpureus]|uniref:GyrI-like domain-containing protein n=1 Tax=Paenibacillus roseopurpureus TaxID=2918901 RepID=A0AA96RKX6_9BACL|nr:GyrI-like domain-containing protein [Paenibacillus sp. MBLB1832]WNR45170.1 GyrI-like domain-containing protein [Paenibacillus sp. MBLB1832]
MEKLDLAKAYKSYYSAPVKPQLVQFGPISYVSIVGQGDPNESGFAAATEALYTVAYSVKAHHKKLNQDFTVAKLEGQWWVDGDPRTALQVPKELWHWKLLIRMPDYVTVDQITRAREAAAAKKKELTLISHVNHATLHEGTCVQMLHVGPYSTEPETLSQMETYMENNQQSIHGLHHEIYVSDPRRVEPAKLKTILRYPVRPIE